MTLRDALRRDEPFGQYFKEQVRQELVERFGRERVYQSGLRVYTTIDVEMQKAAEASVAKSLAELSARRLAALKSRKRPVPDDDRAAAGGGGRARPAHRPGAGPGRRTQLLGEPFQSRRAGPAATRVGVQAIRLCGGARGRLHPGEPDRPARRAVRHVAGRVVARGGPRQWRGAHHAHRAQDLEQPRRRAHARDGGRVLRRRLRAEARVSDRCRRCRRWRSGRARSRSST